MAHNFVPTFYHYEGEISYLDTTIEVFNIRKKDFKNIPITLETMNLNIEQIKKNTPLSVTYYGWRMPFFGLFPNIVMSNSPKYLECTHCKITELKL